jgi:deoxyribodipyrimidine photo-lyase
MTGASLVWLRDDLRLDDNPALSAAANRGGPITLLYLLDEESPGIRPLGGASRWWLHHSLEALQSVARTVGLRLTLRRGAAVRVIPEVVAEVGASAVLWNRRYGPSAEVDAAVTRAFVGAQIEVCSFPGNLLFEPGTVATAAGAPFRVFTAFWNASRAHEVRAPLPAPSGLTAARAASEALEDWGLLPTEPDWAGGLSERWKPGTQGAEKRLDQFLDGILAQYGRRDELAIPATSMLSAHLRFGEISAQRVWHTVSGVRQPEMAQSAPAFLRELGWREFNWNILHSFPALATANYRESFDRMEWLEPSPGELRAWQHGSTGIALVDAGMRELRQTGYMHNRVRMVVASFLTKNMLVDWRVGEEWFWDNLVDADEANNPANWQWVAGSGADAAPYFRIFNPLLQARTFDPDHQYIDRWLPPADARPLPMLDLAMTRRRALAAYARLRNTVS